MVTSEHIDSWREAETLVLSLNRPHKKNALTGDMYRALTSALEHAAADETVRVVLITATGDCFCAGNDVHSFKTIADVHYTQRPGFNFMKALAQFPKPIVAALPGDAVGIGTTLLLHCDLVYMCLNSRLRMPFVSIGLVPEFGSTTLLTQAIGHQRAAELLFVHQSLDAAKALKLGLVNGVFSADEVYVKAIDVCHIIAKQPVKALQETKRLMKAHQLDAILDKIEQETLAINTLLSSMKLPREKNH